MAFSRRSGTPMADEPSNETPLLEDNDRQVRFMSWRRYASYMVAPFAEQRGEPLAVWIGMASLSITGCLLGLILPKSSQLPTSWYPTVSSCVGYTYFLAWSVSFWPQLLTNLRRKSTQGLSADFCLLNVIGFACYSAYTLLLYYSPYVRHLYRLQHASEPLVSPNDVAFCVHALLLSTLTYAQILFYDGFRLSPHIRKVVLAILGSVALAPVGLLVSSMNLLDCLYFLSYVKIFITLVKYIPQVVLNFRRKSCVGWSIWQILLDFAGGLLSDVQLVGDSYMLQDFSSITGNLAKFFLGFVSISFDIIFMLQHYCLYPAVEVDDEERVSLVVPAEEVVEQIAPEVHDEIV